MTFRESFTDADQQDSGDATLDHATVHGEIGAALNNLGEICAVNRAADQAIVTGTLTSVIWDSVRSDDPNWFDAGTPDRITVAEDGVYIITLSTCWTSSFVATNNIYTHVERIRASDGEQEMLFSFHNAEPDQSTSGVGSIVTKLLAGDSVRTRVYQSSGADKNFGGKNRPSGNPITDSSNAELAVARLI